MGAGDGCLLRRHLMSYTQYWLPKLAPKLAQGIGSLYSFISWTLAGAAYLVKIPPRKERLGTLLSDTTSPNNLRLITMETKGKRKKVIDVDSVTPKLGNISRAIGEEQKASTSTASADDGKKPDHVKIRKNGRKVGQQDENGYLECPILGIRKTKNDYIWSEEIRRN